MKNFVIKVKMQVWTGWKDVLDGDDDDDDDDDDDGVEEGYGDDDDDDDDNFLGGHSLYNLAILP